MIEQTLPTRIQHWDNPESVRIRKYLTGTNLLVDAIGVDVWASPSSVTWSRGKARLYRFRGNGEDRRSVPLLLVYALILRPYILDLVAGRSVVQEFLRQGFDVYLLDWGVPDETDADLGFEDYVLDVLAGAVEVALDTSSAPQLSLLGHCQGGTMAAMYAALEPQLVRNLVLLGAPIDFAPDRPGLTGTWTVDPAESPSARMADRPDRADADGRPDPTHAGCDAAAGVTARGQRRSDHPP